MKFRTRFDESLKLPVFCTEEEKRTKSEFADECDINKIMARYKRTGVLPVDVRKQAAAKFGDFSQLPSFMEMQDMLIAANDLFMALPAAVRKQFGNDPHEFLAAAETKEGRELLQKLGLGAENASGETDPTPQGPAPSPAAGVAAKKVWKGALPPKEAQERLKEEYDFPAKPDVKDQA